MSRCQYHDHKVPLTVIANGTIVDVTAALSSRCIVGDVVAPAVRLMSEIDGGYQRSNRVALSRPVKRIHLKLTRRSPVAPLALRLEGTELGHAAVLAQGARTRLLGERAHALAPTAYGRGTQASLFERNPPPKAEPPVP